MADVNERSFRETHASSGILAHTSATQQGSVPAPIWRFRSRLKAPGVVRTLKTKIALALRPAQRAETAALAQAEVAAQELAHLSLSDNDQAAETYVEYHLAEGMSVDTVFLNLLAPAARHLGELWETDAANFVSVTLAMGRLQRIMRHLGQHFFEEPAAGAGESVLLTIIPGEQHSFGLSMVTEFFRRAGWNLCTGPFSSHQELTSLVSSHWFDIVGFSVSSDRKLDELRNDVQSIRQTSRNKHVGIILGGPMVAARPDLLTSIGADMISGHAATAPEQALGLISRMKSHN